MNYQMYLLPALIGAALFLSFAACETPQPQATPPMEVIKVQDAYEWMSDEKKLNQDRFRLTIQQQRLFEFFIKPTYIGGLAVQELIESRWIPEDSYVLCWFEDQSEVLSLNTGERVKVRGVLNEALEDRRFRWDGRGVIFKSCTLAK